MISDGARRHAASARSSGFVLVGVVWFLAIMTLLASAAVLWVGRSLDATENRRKVLLRELEEHALLARVAMPARPTSPCTRTWGADRSGR